MTIPTYEALVTEAGFDPVSTLGTSHHIVLPLSHKVWLTTVLAKLADPKAVGAFKAKQTRAKRAGKAGAA